MTRISGYTEGLQIVSVDKRVSEFDLSLTEKVEYNFSCFIELSHVGEGRRGGGEVSYNKVSQFKISKWILDDAPN